MRLDRPEEARRVLSEARRIRPALSLEEIKRFFGTRAAADLAVGLELIDVTGADIAVPV